MTQATSAKPDADVTDDRSAARLGKRSLRRRMPAAKAATGTSLRGLLPLTVALMLWQLLGSDDNLSFPRPSTWVQAIRQMNGEGVLLPAVTTTLETFVLALISVLVLGVVTGLLIGGSATAMRALGPLVDFARSVPPPVFIPVVALILGIGIRMTVAAVTLSVIWPLLLGTMIARRTISTARLELGSMLHLRWHERIFKIVLPSVLPGAAAGIKLSITYALMTTLLVDIIGSASGIGRLISERQQTFDAAAVWGLLALVAIFGYAVNLVIERLEHRMMRNHGLIG